MRKGSIGAIAGGIAILLSLFQLYTAGFGSLEAMTQRSFHLGAILVLIFLWVPATKEKRRFILVVDVLLAMLAAGITSYLLADMDRIVTRMRYVDPITDWDMAAGIAMIALLLEATRRVCGWPLVWVSLAALLYVWGGSYLPGAVGHAAVDLPTVVEQLFLLTDGIYGIPLGAAATYIYVFLILGSILYATGIGNFFIDIACYFTGRATGGPGKVAVVSSALFGTISGSAPANVLSVGTFTIPLMKRVGYGKEFAGAVEAVASTGGQIMPPVMGTAAFIMADVTNIPYAQIASAALVPAVLFYVGLFAAVHLRAAKTGLKGMDSDELPILRSILARTYYFVPLLVLIALLASGRSALSAAFYTIFVTLAVAMIAPATRQNYKALVNVLIEAAKSSFMISTATAASGIVIGVILMTGLGFKLINAITLLGSSSLMLSLFLTMVTCLVLGMGVPTAAAYILVAMLAAPALVKLGVPILGAHLFVFYYAIISVITPPVALAAYAAAGISGSSPTATGWMATRLGLFAFIVPFMFVYQPALLGVGVGTLQLVGITVVGCVGVITLAAGIEGRWLREAGWLERILLIATGILLVLPDLLTDLIGAVLLIGVSISQWIRQKASTRYA